MQQFLPTPSVGFEEILTWNSWDPTLNYLKPLTLSLHLLPSSSLIPQPPLLQYISITFYDTFPFRFYMISFSF